MFAKLLFFELRYHFRQVSFRLAAVLFFVLGAVAIRGGFGGELVYKNAPYAITSVIGLISLCAIFTGTLFTANVVLRDNMYKMDAVVFTTSIRRSTYFLVRYLGLIITVFTTMFLTALGVFCSTVLMPGVYLGPFNIWHYLQPLLVFALPNVLFSSGIIFCTAVLTNNTRAIYVAGVLLYILYLTAAIAGNSPMFATSVKLDNPSLLPLLTDPFGLSSFYGTTRMWTDVQRNTQLLELNGIFLWNRMVWVIFTVLLLGICYRYFNFRSIGRSAKKVKKHTSKPVAIHPFRNFKVQPSGWSYNYESFITQFKLETISLFKHIPFMVIMLLWIFLFTVETKDALFGNAYGVHYYPLTGIIIEELRNMKFALVLIIFFASELLGKERAVNMQALIYTTPVKYGVLWASKCLTLVVLVMLLISANICIGVGLQLSHGYTAIDLPLYFSLYYYTGAPMVLLVVLLVFIQNIVQNKYFGMLLGMVVALMWIIAPRLGIEHYMWRYATVPDLNFSYMNNFGHYASAFNWYMLYWLGFAGILALFTIGMWQNSLHNNWKQRGKKLINYLYNSKLLVLLCLGIFIFSGFIIYRGTNLTGKYKNKQQQLDWQIRYEQKFKQYAYLEQPIIKAVKTEVELYPAKGIYTVKGSYLLKNQSDVPVKSVFVSFDNAVNNFDVTIKDSRLRPKDLEFNQQWIDLNAPLLPGDSIVMQFNFKVIRNGFTPFNNENSVVENGSYVELEKYVPQLGYNSGIEIEDLRERKLAGLAAKTTYPVNKSINKIDLETTIATEADQYVVTVGNLQQSWMKDGRRYYHYKTSTPVNFMFALSSARYVIKEVQHKGVSLKVCYHNGHEENLNTMLQSMKDALDYGNSNFSPYPFKTLTLAEIPQYRGAATAYPGVVFSAERINFLGNFKDEKRPNLGYTIVAHEVGHEWWANQLVPTVEPGKPMLTESLAKYTEMMVAEQAFGKMKLRKFLREDRQLYFAMRTAGTTEPPLLKTEDQTFVYYQKGALVMYAVKEAIGAEKFNMVLARLLQNKERTSPAAFYKALINEVPVAQQPFVNSLFNTVTDYSLSLKTGSIVKLANGKYQLKVTVLADQFTQGQKNAGTPDLMLDLAIFSEQENQLKSKTQPVYLGKYHIQKQQTEITILTDKKPGTVMIDPFNYLLDPDPDDNFISIK